MKKICILWVLVLLSSCSLLKAIGEPQKLIKNAAVTGVAYASGGIVPAVVVGGSALAVDAILPHNTTSVAQISSIETEMQMKAFIISNLTNDILYGSIAALLIFMVVVPWATQRRAKRKMKDEMKLKFLERELEARRLRDL